MKKKTLMLVIISLIGVSAIIAINKIGKVNIFKRAYSFAKGEKCKLNTNINNGIYKSAIEFSNTVSWVYDPTYYNIKYPSGDVPSGGACTDVVIRVLRKNNLDLQQAIHEDMLSNFSAYPNKWGLSNTDANIDHRRVPNIMRFFERQGFNLPITKNTDDYKPGDIVTWSLSTGTTHIGIVLENQDIFHNMGPTSRIESGFLFSYKIIGHYRI